MKHLEKEFSQSCSLKRPSCSAASGIKPNNIRQKVISINAFKKCFNPEFKFPMKHLEKEFSQSCSLKRPSCSAASGIQYYVKTLFQLMLFKNVLILNLVPNEAPGERILTMQPKKTKLLCCFRDKAKQYSSKRIYAFKKCFKLSS